jgi:hypothetical protein
MRVWLDDSRPPPPGYDFVARTAAAAIKMLASGLVKEISLDHDLSLCGEHCIEDSSGKVRCVLGRPMLDFCPCPCHDTGYTVVCWMEENKVWPATVRIHTSNPVGRSKMEAAILASAPPGTYKR